MRRFLAKGIPDVGVSEYDPEQQGSMPHAFDWSSYDAVLLGEDYGTAGTGLQWLEDLSSSPNFPAAVLIIAKADPRITAKALKAGAHDVIVKREISPEGLCETVRAAAAAVRAIPDRGVATGDKRGAGDAEIVARAPRSD